MSFIKTKWCAISFRAQDNIINYFTLCVYFCTPYFNNFDLQYICKGKNRPVNLMLKKTKGENKNGNI